MPVVHIACDGSLSFKFAHERDVCSLTCSVFAVAAVISQAPMLDAVDNFIFNIKVYSASALAMRYLVLTVLSAFKCLLCSARC